MNIVVTDEQHALLSELASLDNRRSVASVVRELVDQVTPLLRVTVPAMRAAKQEIDTNRSALREALPEFLAALRQHDLLDTAEPERSEPPAAKARTDAPHRPSRRRRPRSNSQGQ